ncbi:MAG TPA: hypothetical protein VH008_06225 [Pseudonocardia sp.]|nr:hypothetical protein [Pseudonocardia sp.]
MIELAELRAGLDGRELPGGELAVPAYESALADHALLAGPAAEDPDGAAHPLWLLILAMRGMGVTVDELCALAGKCAEDTLLFGNCSLSQVRPVEVGGTYRVSATVGPVNRKTSRSGGVLDIVAVWVTIRSADTGEPAGTVVNEFIFKRGAT